MKNQSHETKVILAFAAVYIVWGSSFFGVHLALKSFPPLLLSTLRFLLAGLGLSVWCILKKEQFPTGTELIKSMVCGIALFIGGTVSVAWAQQYISSSLASIIITTPFWFVVLDKRQWGFYFSNKWIPAGLIIGLLGVVLLLGFKQGRAGKGDETMQIISILTIVGGSFLWVFVSLYLKYKPIGASSFANTGVQLTSAGLFCGVISIARNEPQTLLWSGVRLDGLLALFYLSIFSSLITFMAYVWLIKVKPPAVVSTYAYVNPLVAVLLGRAFAGETISILQLGALALILCGVLFVNIPKYRILS